MTDGTQNAGYPMKAMCSRRGQESTDHNHPGQQEHPEMSRSDYLVQNSKGLRDRNPSYCLDNNRRFYPP